MGTGRHTHPRKGERHLPVDLKDDGVLFMINAQIFHPLGFGLAYQPETGEFVLLGDGCERWSFSEKESGDNDAKWEAFQALLGRGRART